MKTLAFVFISLIAFGCSNFKEPSYMRRHPGSVILTKDKRVIKDNLKYTKEHQKAARQRREELANYLHENEIRTEHKKSKNHKQ